MINDRQFGETDAVQMTPDRPTDSDRKYLVSEFVRLLYAINPATRAADLRTALAFRSEASSSLRRSGSFR